MRLSCCVIVLLLGGACHAAPASEAYRTKSGNPAIDRFVAAVQRRDAASIATAVRFDTMSGRYPQYKTAADYLAWVRNCRIRRVGQNGLDAADNTVAIDPSLGTGPIAVRVLAPLYWIDWECPTGKYRQALNADYEAPKIIASEMLPRESDFPVMRRPQTRKGR